MSRAVVVALVGLAAGGCIARNGFRCDEGGRECRSDGEVGVCTEAGYCGFVDDECRSGLRYGDEAPGELAGLCVGAENADAGPDDPDADPSDLVDFAPSNIPLARLTDGTGELGCDADDGAVTIDTDAGTIARDADSADLLPAGAAVTLESQITGPDLRVFSLGGLAIENGCDVRVTGAAVLVFAVNGSVSIGGELDLTGGRGALDAAGPGGFAGGTLADPAGQGPGGGGATADGSGAVGGGGGGHGGVGGDGGDRNGPIGGAGGAVVGADDLVPILGGSGGSFGGTSGTGTPGTGGGGGGALQISARGTIAIDGAINAGGGGGGGAPADDGGGGGGAGGAILIEGGAIAIAGVVAANGGGGGAGADDVASAGADGQHGTPSAARAQGGPAAGKGTKGGAGGAGDTPDGEEGVTTMVANPNNCGGGGGGAGRVHLRSSQVSTTGVVTPVASEASL
jgi:hypothetical protein